MEASLLDGSLETAALGRQDEAKLEAARCMTKNLLMEALADGSLDKALAQKDVPSEKSTVWDCLAKAAAGAAAEGRPDIAAALMGASKAGTDWSAVNEGLALAAHSAAKAKHGAAAGLAMATSAAVRFEGTVVDEVGRSRLQVAHCLEQAAQASAAFLCPQVTAGLAKAAAAAGRSVSSTAPFATEGSRAKQAEGIASAASAATANGHPSAAGLRSGAAALADGHPSAAGLRNLAAATSGLGRNSLAPVVAGLEAAVAGLATHGAKAGLTAATTAVRAESQKASRAAVAQGLAAAAAGVAFRDPLLGANLASAAAACA
jgi:hypothetical protein